MAFSRRPWLALPVLAGLMLGGLGFHTRTATVFADAPSSQVCVTSISFSLVCSPTYGYYNAPYAYPYSNPYTNYYNPYSSYYNPYSYSGGYASYSYPSYSYPYTSYGYSNPYSYSFPSYYSYGYSGYPYYGLGNYLGSTYYYGPACIPFVGCP